MTDNRRQWDMMRKQQEASRKQTHRALKRMQEQGQRQARDKRRKSSRDKFGASEQAFGPMGQPWEYTGVQKRSKPWFVTILFLAFLCLVSLIVLMAVAVTFGS